MVKAYSKFEVDGTEIYTIIVTDLNKNSKTGRVIALSLNSNPPNRFTDSQRVENISNITDAELSKIFAGDNYRQVK
jgi:hypothetical protein